MCAVASLQFNCWHQLVPHRDQVLLPIRGVTDFVSVADTRRNHQRFSTAPLWKLPLIFGKSGAGIYFSGRATSKFPPAKNGDADRSRTGPNSAPFSDG
jgi:hypothetical protein